MTALLQFTFHNSHFTLISHLPFSKRSMQNAKSLKIDNCELIIEPTAGGV